jgi:hypothetical protein
MAMARVIEGGWEDLVKQDDLRGHEVRVIVLDQEENNPWIKSLLAWANSHYPIRSTVVRASTN